MSDAEKIEAARRVQEFVDDPAIKEALAGLHQKFYQEFRTAKTADDRLTIHAKATALDALMGELLRVVNVGTLARADRDRRERSERSRTPSR